MYNFKISNQQYIKKILDSNPNPEEIKEIVLRIKDPDLFLDDLLDNIAEDPAWPLAVPPLFIVDQNDENQVKHRARHIIDILIEQDVFGLNVLDFGCGTGHASAELGLRMARKVVGFDIEASSYWEKLSKEQPTLFFTDDWNKVLENGPYDLVMLYDVIDHIVDRDPKDVLTDISKVLANDGFIVMRCHPWISRTGAHLYYTLNRAYAHLIFDDLKLKARGYDSLLTRKVIHPMWSYKKWIEKANLKIVKEEKILEPVEDYFLKNNLFKDIIQKHFSTSPLEEYRESKGDLSRVMSFHFVDFTLTK